MTVTITKAEGTTVEEMPLIGLPAVNQTSDIGKLESVPLTLIQASDFNPRSLFEQSSIEELAQSIRENGLINPITLRHTGHNYEIIAGERRFRAYTHLRYIDGPYLNGKVDCWKDIPAIIVNRSDEQASMAALIENLHRVELNPIERAKGYQRLAGTFGMTQQQIAEKVGIDQATVSGALGLLKLPGTVIERLASGQLSASHGAALLQLDDADEQVAIADKAVADNWTVRHIRDEVNEILAQRKQKEPEAPAAVATLTEAAKEKPAAEATYPDGRACESCGTATAKSGSSYCPACDASDAISKLTKAPSLPSVPATPKTETKASAPASVPETKTAAAASTRISSGVSEVQPQTASSETAKPSEPAAGGVTYAISDANDDWLYSHYIDNPDSAINKLRELMETPEIVQIPAIAVDAFESALFNGEVTATLTPAEQIVATKCGFDTETAIGYMSTMLVRRVLACIENGHNIAFTLPGPTEGAGE